MYHRGTWSPIPNVGYKKTAPNRCGFKIVMEFKLIYEESGRKNARIRLN